MIKKLLYGVVIAAGLVSCNDDYTDWSAPQHNDPETPMELPNISVQTATASINVGELEDAGTVNVSLVNFQGDIPENVQVTDRYVEVVPTAATAAATATVSIDASGVATVADLNDAVVEALGDNAESVQYNINGNVFVKMLIDGYATCANVGTIQFAVTPKVIPDVPAAGYIFDTEPVLYLTGSNYDWGGTWLPLVPVNGHPTMSWRIVYLHEGEEFKFAPQAGWGNDFGMSATVTDNAGMNPSGGDNIKVGNAGWYMLIVDNTDGARTVTINKPEIYLIGDTWGAWDAAMPDAMFDIPTEENGVFVSPKFKADAAVRMHVAVPGADWWQSEFIGLETGEVDFRGNGGDQARVNVKAGQRVYLNLNGGGALYK